ncbi:MAG: MFS transporter [Acidimicrobiales bacterium]
MRHEKLLAICISTLLVTAGQGVVSPILPLYAKEFDVSTAMVGLTITSFGLARLVSNVPAGMFADRRGRRILLVGGPLVTAVGMAGSAVAGSIWWLLVWRFVAGAGSGVYMTGAQIYLVDIADPSERGRYMAINQGALLVGFSAGPALGGVLSEAYGLSTPFLVVAVAAALTALYGALRLPETGKGGSPPPSGNGVDRQALLRSPALLAVGLVSMSIFSIRAGVRQALVPLELTDRFGWATDDIGLLFTALGVIGLVLIVPAGWSVDRFGARAVIVPTALAGALGIGVVAAAGSISVYVAGLAIAAIGTGVTGPAPAAFVADLVDDADRGAAMGLYRTLGDAGVVASPFLSGALADATSFSTAIMANAIFVALAGVTFFVVTAPRAGSTNLV